MKPPTSHHETQAEQRRRKRKNRLARIRGRELVAQGLTWKGMPRKTRLWPELARLDVRARKSAWMRAFNRKQREHFYQLGLTARGTVRKLRKWDLGDVHGDARHRLYQKTRTREFNLIGLSAHRKPLRNFTPPGRVELAWREFRRGMEVAA